ncbi:MAG: IS110 family transposase [Gammaproteobacteria bacterium]|nr:IS110 family transposase [Gammaproteobacteria bacterium]
MQHLIRVCPDPRQLVAMSTSDLIAAFHAHNFKMGPKTAAKIITYSHKVLLPDPDVIAIRSELLHHDLILLEAVEERIAVIKERLVDLVAQTPYQIWTELKGLSHIQVARLAASIGDPDHYNHAKQVFRRSGLVSGRNDSGVRQKRGKGNKVLKTGDVHLRRALLDAIHTFILHQPLLFSYYSKLKLTKPDLVARVATARRANGILCATLRDQHSTTLVYK